MSFVLQVEFEEFLDVILNVAVMMLLLECISLSFLQTMYCY